MPLTKVKSGGVSDSITLTSPDINAPDIDGGTIDNAVIGGSTAAAGSFTTITATGGSSSNWNTAYGWGDHSTQSYATQTYVGTDVSNLVDSSPAALDTLNELAAALGDDPNFATTVTNSIALKAPLASPSFTGTATMDGLTVDNITIDGNEIDVSSGNLTLDIAGEIILDADTQGSGNGILLKDNGIHYGSFFRSSSNFHIKSEDSNHDIIFMGNDGGSEITALTLDMSAAGAATFNSTIASAGVTSSNSITMTAGNMSLNSTSDGNQAFRYYRADGTLVVQQYPYNNRFNVQTYNNQGLRLKSDGSGQIELEGNVVINEDSADVDFRVESSGNANMLFVDGGNNNLMIGNTVVNPASGFSAQAGFGYSSSGQVQIAATSNLATLVLGQNQGTNGSILDFRKQGAMVGTISVTGAGTTYNTTSDRRLKNNIETITNGTDKLMAMNPVTHGWKADPEADTVHGFIAQEMMDIVPEAVSGDPESDEMMSMDYGRITPVLVAALQDAHKKIAELETRLNELEGK